MAEGKPKEQGGWFQGGRRMEQGGEKKLRREGEGKNGRKEGGIMDGIREDKRIEGLGKEDMSKEEGKYRLMVER